MAATIRRLVPRPEKMRREQAAQLRQALLPFEAEMPDAVRDLIAHIDRKTAARTSWTFAMISPLQHAAVVDWLAANSVRPMKAIRAWALLFTVLDMDTGEVMLTRDEIAGSIGVTPGDVSTIMSELESIGAIIRRMDRVPGMRGRGRVRYFMNPIVGTHLAGRARDQAQAEAPPIRAGFTVTQGGKA